MPGTTPDDQKSTILRDQKTDNFSTFLDVLSGGKNAAEVLSKQILDKAVAAYAAVPPVVTPVRVDQADPANTVTRLVAANGGSLPISELLVPPFTSLGSLMATIQELRTFGLTQSEGPVVRLTPAGEAVAQKLGPQPAPEPH